MLRTTMIIVGTLIALLPLVFYSFLTPRDRKVLMGRPHTISIKGITREYLLSESRSIKPTKLVIGLHGFGDSSKKFSYYTALHNSVDDDTIVVYPNAVKPTQKGIKSGWNSGFCCGSGWIGEVDDVAFIETIINKLSAKFGIVSANTFVVGFSNGAFMAQKFAAEKPELLGGVIAVSGTIGTTASSITPISPVPILLIHGLEDKTIPFGGGITAGNPDFNWLPFGATRSTWETTNGDNAETKVILYDDGEHVWRGWRLINFWHSRTDTSAEAVNFMDKVISY